MITYQAEGVKFPHIKKRETSNWIHQVAESYGNLGKKDNPYPYMLACDIYVQPSRYEGCPVTIQEAQALGKPVIATAFPTVKSAIQDRVNGVIVPLDNEGCAQGIVQFVQSNGPSSFQNTSRLDIENKTALERFYSLF